MSFDLHIRFNPADESDVRRIHRLESLSTQYGTKTAVVRMLLDAFDHHAVRLDEESIQRIVCEIERRGVAVKIDADEQKHGAVHHHDNDIIVSATIAKKWG